MDTIIARKTWRTAEPIHGMIYFVPEAAEHYRLAGVTDPRAGYFASRSAPLGEASAELVIATFYNFNPDYVRAAVPAVWQSASPADLLDARLAAADAALRRLLGDAVASEEMVAAAQLARSAALSAGDRLEAARCSPLTPTWHGPTIHTSCCGMPKPCSASSAVTVI